MMRSAKTSFISFATTTFLLFCALFLLPQIAYAGEGPENPAALGTPEKDAPAASAVEAQPGLKQQGVNEPSLNEDNATPASEHLENQASTAEQSANGDSSSNRSLNAQSEQTSQSAKEDTSSQNLLSAQSESVPAAGLSIQAHVQNIGDQGWRQAGSSYETRATAGTSGLALRMESVEIKIDTSIPGSIQYQAHVQNDGWQAACADGERAGTKGRSLRVEGLNIALIGEVSRYYDVVYRVHVQNDGWQDWRENGQYAGTTGRGLRLEAIEIYLRQKTQPTDQQNEGIVGVVSRAHVQNDGWHSGVTDGATTGSTGRGLRMEAMNIWLNAGCYGGSIVYQAHVQRIGWQDAKANGETAGTSGQALRMEALQISLTGEIAQHFDVMYRAHVQNIGWQPWTFNGGLAGTTGQSLRVEALQIKLMRKGDTTLADGGYIITTILDPNMALDDPGATESAGAQMQTYAANNGYAQRFYLKNVGDGNVTLQSVASALYLTDSAGTVRQQGETGANDQRWRLVWDGGYNIVNAGTGKSFALAAWPSNGVAVNTAAKNTTDQAQHWMLQEAGIAPDGTYVITNAPSGRVLDIWHWDRTNGGEVKIGNSNGGNNQKFTIAYLGGNQYSIRNAVTKRAVQASGSDVNMWSYSGASHQKWRLEIVGPKTFRFVNIGNGQAMDVENSSINNGSNVLTSSPSGAESQKFTLAITSIVQETVNIGVPVIYQNPELPTGCESVALTEALNYYGFGLSKTAIADYYMPWSGSDFVYSFMGNPHTDYGAAIMAPGITNTANDFLSGEGSSLRATDLTGASLGSLYGYLDRGAPVVVWNTMYMYEPGGVQAYQDGYEMRSNTHAVTLSGYDEDSDTVLVADPLSGSVWRDRYDFERLYNIMGRQAVVIE